MIQEHTDKEGGYELDPWYLINYFWTKKIFFAVCISLGALSSILYALSLPNIYKSEALIAPVETASGGGLSGMARQLGGLASIAGLDLGTQATSRAALALEVIESRKFIYSFIEKYNLKAPLLATEGWDAASNLLVYDKEIYDETNGVWLREPKGLRGSEPSIQEAYEHFVQEILQVDVDEETGFIKVSVSFYSPYLGKDWVNYLIEDINDAMRQRALSEAESNLNYLYDQLSQTSVAEMQETFYRLVEEQMKSLMLAKSQSEFVFNIIDPPVIAEVKSGPSRLIIVVCGLVVTLMLSSLYLTVSLVIRHSKRISDNKL